MREHLLALSAESLADFGERLIKADAELKDGANHSHTEMDRQRRLAKAEGVRLALSYYLEEYGRSAAQVIDAAHLRRQREWSAQTFGPALRTKGVLEHSRKELLEIEADPFDTSEWIDVVILALDGAWRHGAQPQEIIDAIIDKQTKNEARTWPDWREASEDVAIEHHRG